MEQDDMCLSAVAKEDEEKTQQALRRGERRMKKVITLLEQQQLEIDRLKGKLSQAGSRCAVLENKVQRSLEETEEYKQRFEAAVLNQRTHSDSSEPFHDREQLLAELKDLKVGAKQTHAKLKSTVTRFCECEEQLQQEKNKSMQLTDKCEELQRAVRNCTADAALLRMQAETTSQQNELRLEAVKHQDAAETAEVKQQVEFANTQIDQLQRQCIATKSERELFEKMQDLVKYYKKKVDATEKIQQDLDDANMKLTEMKEYRTRLQQQQKRLLASESRLTETELQLGDMRKHIDTWSHAVAGYLCDGEEATPENLQRYLVLKRQELKKSTDDCLKAQLTEREAELQLKLKATELKSKTAECERLTGETDILKKKICFLSESNERANQRIRILEIEVSWEGRMGTEPATTDTADSKELAAARLIVKSLQTSIAARESELSARDKLLEEFTLVRDRVSPSELLNNIPIDASHCLPYVRFNVGDVVDCVA
eukprot:GHVQ01032998.1.p1 GENE.GHVQ01032998.1~~GHVQ01032998.1.p1  ORF type:complete len:486 (-),score=102.86 GHVQ01032998.1:1380-2837(-)